MFKVTFNNINSITTRNDNKIVVYPIPAGNKLFIKSLHTLESIKMISLTGQIIQQMTLQSSNKSEYQISIPDFVQKGYYILILNDESNNVIRKKILIE